MVFLLRCKAFVARSKHQILYLCKCFRRSKPSQDYEDYDQDYESFEAENKYENYCNQLTAEKNDNSEIKSNKTHINKNLNDKGLLETSFDYKYEDEKRKDGMKESGKIVDKKNIIEMPSNESKSNLLNV
jgi:hypothetical protein